ncbi:uncharacterized protein LOC132562141 [Ylistrum balloti]|uniref:uncharacterized protein LOC132562141 n=1 Tax=Ylistrum balloti TaxID=509963 RepID=UPI002905964A|nr:uncharacterized protein LOC132562141 [Ylistrum balloti]
MNEEWGMGYLLREDSFICDGRQGLNRRRNNKYSIHRREKRQARWGSQNQNVMDWLMRNMQTQQHQQRWQVPPKPGNFQNTRDTMPTPTWAPTTLGTQVNFGGQNWGNTEPTPVRFPSMFNNMARSRNSLQSPSTSFRPPSPAQAPKSSTRTRTSGKKKTSGHSNSPKSVRKTNPSPPMRKNPSAGRKSPSRNAPTAPIPNYPPTMPPRPVGRSKSRRNRPRPQSQSFAPKSNLKTSSIIPPSLLQGLGRAMADKLRSMWMNPLYQQQAKAAGDNFVVNPNPVNVGYRACPFGIMAERCVYNPCPRCRNQMIECWTNPCGGCTGEMYLHGRRIHDCETI